MRKIGLLILTLILVQISGFGQPVDTSVKPTGTITIEIQGLEPSCSSSAGPDTFTVLTYGFGARNMTVTSSALGKPAGTVQPLQVARKLDECSTALFGGVVEGKRFKSAQLIHKDSSDRPLLTIDLTDVWITSYAIGGDQQSDTPAESIQIDYGKICISEGNGGSKLCWDQVKHQATN